MSESSTQFHPLSRIVEEAAKECGVALSEKNAWKTVQVGEDPSETCEVWTPQQDEEDLRVICKPFVQSFPPLQEVSYPYSQLVRRKY